MKQKWIDDSLRSIQRQEAIKRRIQVANAVNNYI